MEIFSVGGRDGAQGAKSLLRRRRRGGGRFRHLHAGTALDVVHPDFVQRIGLLAGDEDIIAIGGPRGRFEIALRIGMAFDAQPSVSPDGKKIAFISEEVALPDVEIARGSKGFGGGFRCRLLYEVGFLIE